MGNHTSKSLKQEQLEAFEMLTNLKQNEIAAFYETFNALAIHGMLNFESCLSFVGIFIPGKNSIEFNRLLFESFDRDFKEFLVGVSLFKSLNRIEDFVNFLFDISDKDHNQGIDKNEFKPLVNWLLYFVGDNVIHETGRNQITEIFKLKLEVNALKREIQELKQIIYQMNSSTSSSLSTSFSIGEEFKRNRIEKKYEKVNEIIAYAFEEYDKTNKGFLSRQELYEFMQSFFYGYC